MGAALGRRDPLPREPAREGEAAVGSWGQGTPLTPPPALLTALSSPAGMGMAGEAALPLPCWAHGEQRCFTAKTPLQQPGLVCETHLPPGQAAVKIPPTPPYAHGTAPHQAIFIMYTVYIMYTSFMLYKYFSLRGIGRIIETQTELPLQLQVYYNPWSHHKTRDPHSASPSLDVAGKKN